MSTVIYDVTVCGDDGHAAREDAAQLVAARAGIRLSAAIDRVDAAVRRASEEPMAMTIRVDPDGTVHASVGPRWYKPVVCSEVDLLVELAAQREAKQ